MFTDFDFSVLDTPDFKEDAVREEIIAPIIRRLGYRPGGPMQVLRSKSLIHPFVMIGSKRHAVNIIPDYTLYAGCQRLRENVGKWAVGKCGMRRVRMDVAGIEKS